MNNIYFVKASKAYSYEPSITSVVYSTLDIDDAVSFAENYYSNNLALVLEAQHYDYFSVSVYSSVIGKANTESIIWTNRNGLVEEEKQFLHDRNINFASDLEQSLLDKFKKQAMLKLKGNVEIKPTIGWSVGKSELNIIKSEDKTIEIINFALEQYKHHLSCISSKSITEKLLPLSLESEIEKDSQSKENKEMWALYETYEQKFYK